MSTDDVSSIDAIINASYETISGPAGKKRDWERQRALFLPGARLIPTAMKAGDNENDLGPQLLAVDQYIQRAEPYFRENGFYEKEIARRTEQIVQIAHAWSTYESRHRADDAAALMERLKSVLD